MLIEKRQNYIVTVDLIELGHQAMKVLKDLQEGVISIKKAKELNSSLNQAIRVAQTQIAAHLVESRTRPIEYDHIDSLPAIEGEDDA